MLSVKVRKSKANQDQEWKCSIKKETKPKNKKIQKNQLRLLIRKNIQKNSSRKYKQAALKNIHQLQMCMEFNDLLCSICLETLIYPITLECGHTFCLACVQTYHKKDTINRCCLCRNIDNLDFYQPNPTIQKIISLAQKREVCDTSQQYRKRKDGIDKNMKERGVPMVLKEHDELKIKVKNGWERARLTKVQHCGAKTYYLLNTILKEQQFLICSTSKNLMILETNKQSKKEQVISDIFMDAGLMSNFIHQNIYNLDDLMWPDNLDMNSPQMQVNQRQNLPASQNAINGIEIISLDEVLDLSSWMEIPLTRRRVHAPEIIEID